MEEKSTIEALLESNDMLQGEIARLKESNSTVRRVNSVLRKSLEVLRNQVAVAAENDETFKAFCDGEFDAQVIEAEDAGLAESGSQVEAQG